MSEPARIGPWVQTSSNTWQDTRTGKEIEGNTPGELVCIECGEPGETTGCDGMTLWASQWCGIPGDGSWTLHMRCSGHTPPREWSFSGKS